MKTQQGFTPVRIGRSALPKRPVALDAAGFRIDNAAFCRELAKAFSCRSVGAGLVREETNLFLKSRGLSRTDVPAQHFFQLV